MKTVKIAIYKNITSGIDSAIPVADYFEESENYLRTSEIVKVNFPELELEETTTKQIDAIEKQIIEEISNPESKLNKLKQQKQKLLSTGKES